MLKNQAFVQSADGTRLALAEAGNPDGPEIVFIHGYCLSKEIWKRQWRDPSLADNFRLLFFDLRGHGGSDRPDSYETYKDGQRWADDLNTVITHFELKRPVVVAWSYGGRVVNDYIRYFGAEHLAGINYVAAGTIFVEEAVGSAHAVMTDMYASDAQKMRAAEEAYIANILDGDGDVELNDDVSQAVRSTSAQLRKVMRERRIDYEPELATLSVPALISHGDRDSIVSPLMSERLVKHIPSATLSVYHGNEHTLFLSDAVRFNRELAQFANRVSDQSRAGQV